MFNLPQFSPESSLMVMFLSLNQIRRSLVPIKLLREATERIAAKDFTSRVHIESRDEFAVLGASFNTMAQSLEHHLEVMTTINYIGVALSTERDTDRLLEIIVTGAQKITNADGGAVYLVTDAQQLELSIMCIASLQCIRRGPAAPPIPLYDMNGTPNTSMVAAYAALKDDTINIPDIYTAESFDFSGNYQFDQDTGYRTQSILTVPMKNHEGEIIGVLQLFNAQDRSSQAIVPFSDEDRRVAESLASQAAVALTNKRLAEEFKLLFESLIELLGTAIDEKSPYTGGHYRRVPVLTMMLAEAVNNIQEGPLKAFTLSEQELYELKIAALLHDCGKVVTPVHIVDKATKLETIFDRIHLIDTRFAVLKRDLYIQFLHQKITALEAGKTLDIPVWEEDYTKQLQQLEADRRFLHTCNFGEEFMSEKQQERVKGIAQTYTWVNIEGKVEPFLSENEVYNLTIPKGTLTPEEREVIDYHVIATIKMLEALPYPKYLRNVPTFAGVHHECMDGKGYPLGLTREQIPIPGRILGLADIFEALTAKDRPYRKRKTLQEALQILESMKNEGYIDPDLFDVFIKEKVYLRYALAYLDPEQIDA